MELNMANYISQERLSDAAITNSPQSSEVWKHTGFLLNQWLIHQSVEGFSHHSLLEVRADIWNIAVYCAERKSSVGLALTSNGSECLTGSHPTTRDAIMGPDSRQLEILGNQFKSTIMCPEKLLSDPRCNQWSCEEAYKCQRYLWVVWI